MSTITTTVKQLTSHRILDQLAFLIVLFCFAAMGCLLTQVVAKSPLNGSAVFFVYALFAYLAVQFIWQKLTQSPSEPSAPKRA